jgi:hypothetical protein
MIFRFISDADWHFLFSENADQTSKADIECAVPGEFLKCSKTGSVSKNIIFNIAFGLQPKHENLLENRKLRD